MFNLILKKLDERGISPVRVDAVVTQDGCEFNSSAPFIYDDENGDQYTVEPYFGGYRVMDGFGERVAFGDHAEHVEDLLPEILYCPMYSKQ